MVEHSMKSKSYNGWKNVRKNDLVLNRFKAHLGVFFCSSYDGMVSFHYGVYAPKTALNVKFYEYLFHSKQYCDMFAELSNGITVGLQNLSNANFYAAKCAYPPLEEQNRIVDYLENKCAVIGEAISTKKEQLATLEEYKKSIIYEYVTGKKEVPAV
jgi:type I restriction enzyme S subunit